MPRVFIYIAVVSVLICVTHAQQTDATTTRDRINEKPRNSNSSQIKVYEDLFRKSFSNIRKEHADAIKRLERMGNYERLYKVIVVLSEKMVEVLETSKTLIESVDFNPDKRTLPQNVTVQSAISTVLENTALFSDVVLHFPHLTQRVLKSQRKWNTIMNWSMNFTGRSKHLLDPKTITIIHLASQELNIVEREPEYSNPYSNESRETKKEDTRTKSKKKEKRKRGPQMAKIDL